MTLEITVNVFGQNRYLMHGMIQTLSQNMCFGVPMELFSRRI